MNSYKNWTPEQRSASLRLTNKAKEMGLIEEPKKCRICGQTEGILHLHNEDYDATLELTPKMINGTATQEEIEKVRNALVPICWRCHMMLHKRFKHPRSFNEYMIDTMILHKRFPAVYRPNDWAALNINLID